MRFALVVAATAFFPASAWPIDKDRLREVIYLPRLTAVSGIAFHPTRGLVLPGEEPDVPAEVHQLKQALKGDPSDAERYFRLGELHALARDKDASRAACTRAADLFRQRLKAAPNDGRLHTQLGDCLLSLQEDAASEAAFRRAVELSPNDWHCWAGLASFLQTRASNLLLTGAPGGAADPLALIQMFLTRRGPPPEVTDRARKLLDESSRCLERAVQAAPRESQAHVHRARGRLLPQLLEQYALILRGQQVNPMAWAVSPDILADLREAARLDPKDPCLVGSVGFYEFLGWMARSGPNGPAPGDNMPEDLKQKLHAGLDQLDRLAQVDDRKAAARASEVRGLLFVSLGDMQQAEGDFHRALELDPRRSASWNVVIAMLTQDEKRLPQALNLAQRRLQHQDNAYNRLVVAKVHDYLHQDDKAEEQIVAGLKLEPDDFRLNLALAAVRLQRARTAADLAEVGKQLDKAEKLLNAEARGDGRNDLLAIRAFYLALTDDVDGARARLQQVLQEDPRHEPAREALQVLEK